MKTTFKKVALVSALMATTAIIAPTSAFATAAVSTSTGTALTVQAPFKTALTPGYGLKARVAVTRDYDTVGNLDNMRLYAFLYNNGAYVGYVRSAAATGNGVALVDQTVTLPTSALTYTQVAFAYLYEANEAGNAAADDTLNGVAANTRILLLTPPNSRTAGAGVGLSAVDVTPITGSGITTGQYTTNGGAAAAEANAIGALPAVVAGAVNVTSYAGPVLQSAQSKALMNGDDLKLTFDTALKAIAPSSTVPAPQIKVNGPTLSNAGLTTDPLSVFVTTAGSTVVRFKDGAAAFNGQLTTVDVKFVADASPANFISDEAGNGPVVSTGTSITAFAPPAFAGKTADVLITGGTAIATNDNITAAFSAAGLTLTNNQTLILQLNAAELFDSTGADWTDDIALTGNGTLVPTISSSGANSSAIGVTLTAVGGEVLTIGSDGTVKINGTALTVALAKGATPLTTAENQALTSNTAAKSVFLGIAPPLVRAKTVDANANGVLDGAQIDYGAALSTPLPANNGVVIANSTNAATTAAVTVSVDPTAPNVLRAVAPEATLIGFLPTGQTAASNLNTGVIGGNLPYTVSVTTSGITYAQIYDASTGSNKKIANLAAVRPLIDGAKPVVLSVQYLPEQGTSPSAGQLQIVASEPLSASGLVDSSIFLGGASLQLLNLNDGITPVTGVSPTLSKTSVAGDTATIGVLGSGSGKVSANVVGKALTLNATTPAGIADAAGNILATDGSKTVTTGSTVYSGPSIIQAIGTRSTNAVDGNIDTVLVKFSKGVTLATGGAVVDGMFKVQATVNGANYNVSIPKANVDLTSASSGYITLTLPSPGIISSASAKLTALWVEYDTNGTNEQGSTHTSANRLVSTDSTPAEITEGGTDWDLVGGDTSAVTYSQNSTKLYTMDLTGTVTTDGSTAIAKGSIIRADLVDLTTSLTVKPSSLTVPCTCTAGSTTLAVTVGGDVVTALKNAVALGTTSVTAYANVTLNNNTASATGVTLSTATVVADNTHKSYPVTVSTSGAVTSASGAGVTGSLTLEQTPALKLLDTVYQVTNDGTFHFAVGSNTAPTNGFVTIALKQPGSLFTGLTSAVQSFSNHVPFASNVTASGTIGGALGTIDLSKIVSASVASATGWQLVGLTGTIARTSDTTRKAVPVDMTRLLISNSGDTGAPITAWAFDNAANADDQAFLLQNNVVSSALQIGPVTVDAIKQVEGGLALALLNPSGGYTSDTSGDGVIDPTDGNTAISTAQPFTINYPISGPAAPSFSATAGKWSLLTIEQAVANISTWATTNKVAAVIVVGSGNYQKSWFQGSSSNSLSALAKGDRAFIYFSGANTAYNYGR